MARYGHMFAGTAKELVGQDVFMGLLESLEPEDALNVLNFILRDRGLNVARAARKLTKSINHPNGMDQVFRAAVGLDTDGSFRPSVRHWPGV